MRAAVLAVIGFVVAGCAGADMGGVPADGGDAAAGAAGYDAWPDGGGADVAIDVSADASDAGDIDAAWSCDPTVYPLPNEGLAEAPGLGGCPPGMAPAGSICIDCFEASLERVTPSGGATSWSPYDNPGATPVRAVSIEGAVPQAYIDQLQAADACANAGKRLCTDSEWLAACQGTAGNVYPYGNTREPGVCNDARAVHPAVEYYGTTDPWIYSALDNACLDQLPASLDACGANPGCVTPGGIYDLMGNLHEWTDDPAGTFRGGFYVDTVINGNGCLYVTTAHNTSYWDYSTGFRCCADPS